MAAVYLLFKLVGVGVAFVLSSQFEALIVVVVTRAGFVTEASLARVAACPGSECSSADGKTTATVLAWSHTIFNIILAAFFLPIATPTSAFIKSLLPEEDVTAPKKKAGNSPGRAKAE